MLQPLLRRYLPALIIGAVGVGLTLMVAHSAWRHEQDRVSREVQRRISAHYRALQHGITGRIRELRSTGQLLSMAGGRATTVMARATAAIGNGTVDGPWAVTWLPPGRDVAAGLCQPRANCQVLAGRNIPSPGDDGIAARGAPAAVLFDWQPNVPAILVTLEISPTLENGGSGAPSAGRIIGLYMVSALIESVLREYTVPAGLNFYLSESGDEADGGPSGDVRYIHWSRIRAAAQNPAPVSPSIVSGLTRRTLTVANKTWAVHFQPTPESLRDLNEDKAIAILLLGLLTTSALVAYAASWIRRQDRTDAIVAARTDDLAHAMAAAHRANEGKSRFLAAASHDLRQPLQAARNFAATLSFVVTDDEARKVVGRLIRSLDSTSALLTTLMDISRLDTGELVPEVRELAVADEIARLTAEFSPLAVEKGIRLDGVACGCLIRSDPAMLDQILRNLVSNAIRYTDHGRILIGCRRRGMNLAIEVHDTGIGIAAADRERIFEEFHQVHKPHDGEGLGLGLAIARRAARLLGHDLHLTSRVGAGTVFRLVVPLAEATGT